MSRLTDLVEQVAKRDQALGEELRREVAEYTKRRSFGLNFERHSPEGVRLWGRPPRVGDVVNVLPPRGTKEGVGSGVKWLVEAVDKEGGVAHLSSLESDGEVADALLEDLVVFSDFGRPIYPGLRETGRVERGGDKPYQVVINGENYHALESLLYAYEGKVDCIYIDPPYNTGARDWKYNNDYVDSNDQYRHSKWLAFMERRLKLAKRLLNPEDSVLICTIDEKEYLRLGLLLEQTFPDATIQMVTDVINAKGVARQNQFSRVEEYIFFVLLGNACISSMNNNMLDSEIKTIYQGRINGPVPWPRMLRRGSNSLRSHSEGCFYPIFVNEAKGTIDSVGYPPGKGIDRNSVGVPAGCVAVWPMHKDDVEGVWQLSRDTFLTALKNGTAKLGRKNKLGQWSINYLNQGLLREIEQGSVVVTGRDSNGAVVIERKDDKRIAAKTVWNRNEHDASQFGSVLLQALVGKRFSFPKSLYAERDAIRFAVKDKPEALVVDFFAGSGTTLHATCLLNAEDGGRRRCICVTNNEVSDEEARRLTKQGHRPGDPEWERLGICEYVTKPRVTAAITGRTPGGEPIKGYYKFTDEFPMADGFEENAVFYDLTYQDELAVGLDMAFEEIAPILWLRAGATGRCISRRLPGYDVADTYAVLFDYARAREFLSEVAGHNGLRVVYVVTDQDSRFQDVARRLPEGVEPVRLYESYLRSFRINGGEA